jgi:addiction module RelE/StbE family toxin
MYKINVTEPAEKDIDSIIEYLVTVLKASNAASQLINELEEQFGILERNPFIYELEKDEYLNEKGIRSILIMNYLIFYRINQEEKVVTIIRIIYARRNWIQLLSK